MTEDQARHALKSLIKEHLKNGAELTKLMDVVDDKTRPGLPVRGALESLRQHSHDEFTEAEKGVIEELIYLYG